MNALRRMRQELSALHFILVRSSIKIHLNRSKMLHIIILQYRNCSVDAVARRLQYYRSVFLQNLGCSVSLCCCCSVGTAVSMQEVIMLYSMGIQFYENMTFVGSTYNIYNIMVIAHECLSLCIFLYLYCTLYVLSCLPNFSK